MPFLSYSSPKRTSAKATIHVFAINPGRGKKEADNFYFSHFCNSRPAKTFATFNIHKYYYQVSLVCYEPTRIVSLNN